ncbi:MAG: cupin domain-containing protein [Planctomycetota bacterium]
MATPPPPPPNAEARALIDRLALAPHPEGGYYRQTHKSDVVVPADALPAPSAYPGDRAACTCILFLLPAGHRSRPHRVRSEELWLWHAGDPLRLGIADSPGGADRLAARLGPGPPDSFQLVVPPGMWQAAAPIEGGAHGYTLVGCVVAPGFEFDDFEMAE